MIIYYDNSVTERYREIISLGDRGHAGAGEIRVDVSSFPDSENRKALVFFDTQAGAVVLKNSILTEDMKKKARVYVIGLAKGVFSFIEVAQQPAAITFLKARLQTIKNATTVAEMNAAVAQVGAQVLQIEENL